jgi:hypothetical protein
MPLPQAFTWHKNSIKPFGGAVVLSLHVSYAIKKNRTTHWLGAGIIVHYKIPSIYTTEIVKRLLFVVMERMQTSIDS